MPHGVAGRGGAQDQLALVDGQEDGGVGQEEREAHRQQEAGAAQQQAAVGGGESVEGHPGWQEIYFWVQN